MDNHVVEMQLCDSLLSKENTFEMSHPNKKLTLKYENELMTNGSSQLI